MAGIVRVAVSLQWARYEGPQYLRRNTLPQDLAIMLCESPAIVSGEALYAAFSQGDEAAEVAVAALLAYECPSGDSDAILDAAFRAFTQQDALFDADTAYRWAGSLGTARCCDAPVCCCLLCATSAKLLNPWVSALRAPRAAAPMVRPACVSAITWACSVPSRPGQLVTASTACPLCPGQLLTCRSPLCPGQPLTCCSPPELLLP